MSFFPKGIINIISDYSHTLFYVDELKYETRAIYVVSLNYIDLSYSFGYLRSHIMEFSPESLRSKLLEKENERRKIIGIKPETRLWPSVYNKTYVSY